MSRRIKQVMEAFNAVFASKHSLSVKVTGSDSLDEETFSDLSKRVKNWLNGMMSSHDPVSVKLELCSQPILRPMMAWIPLALCIQLDDPCRIHVRIPDSGRQWRGILVFPDGKSADHFMCIVRPHTTPFFSARFAAAMRTSPVPTATRNLPLWNRPIINKEVSRKVNVIKKSPNLRDISVLIEQYQSNGVISENNLRVAIRTCIGEHDNVCELLAMCYLAGLGFIDTPPHHQSYEFRLFPLYFDYLEDAKAQLVVEQQEQVQVQLDRDKREAERLERTIALLMQNVAKAQRALDESCAELARIRERLIS